MFFFTSQFVSWVFGREKHGRCRKHVGGSQKPPWVQIQDLDTENFNMLSKKNKDLPCCSDMYNFIWSMYGIFTFIHHKHQLHILVNFYLTSILCVMASPFFNTARTSLINKNSLKTVGECWRTVFITRNKHATLKSLTSTSLETLETAPQNVVV